jgi:hypothetical protein
VDAATTGLIAGLGSAAIVGTVSILVNRATVKNEWRRAHEDRLMDRRADAYRDVCIFVTRLSGCVQGLVSHAQGVVNFPAGPSIPDDDEWSTMMGTMLAFASDPVIERFKEVQARLMVLMRVVIGGPVNTIRVLPDTAWPDLAAKSKALSESTSHLVGSINDELTNPSYPRR